jgi:hypothetical protein
MVGGGGGRSNASKVESMHALGVGYLCQSKVEGKVVKKETGTEHTKVSPRNLAQGMCV